MASRSIRRLHRFGNSYFIRLLLLIFFALTVDARICDGQSEMPEFTGERLTFSGVDSAAWQSLPSIIAELEQSGRETYYVVVVESSGSSPTATKDYTDRLHEHWLQLAARNGIAFDTQRSVLVVLAIQNRQISVKAGQTLLQDYGLNGVAIDQQLVQPYFIPLAKAGNYPEAVQALLKQINTQIIAVDQMQAPPKVISQSLPVASSQPPQMTITPPATATPLAAPSVIASTEVPQTIQESSPSFLRHVATSPTYIAGTGIAIGLLTLLILRIMHLRVRKPFDVKRASFRQHVVELSDDIDLLRERHRKLPFTDKDYIEPMIGETLTMYDGIQTSLETLRQRWLELMDVWDKVDALKKKEHFFGRSALLEASKLLETVPVSDVENSLNEQCVKTLDRLEDAHAQVQRLAKSLDEDLVRIHKQLSELQNVQLATEPYQPALEKVAQMRTLAAKITVPDPIGCLTIQTNAQEVLRSVGSLTERILQHRRGIDELHGKLNTVTVRLASLRSAGMKFREEGSDPSPLFPTIQHHCEECLKLLDLADANTAAEHLKQGFELAAQSQSAIQLQVDSQAFCRREFPIRTNEQHQLESQLKTLNSVFTALESEFAPASWMAVANLQSTSSDTVSHANTILSDATLAGSDEVQFYQRAAAALRQLKQLQSDTSIRIASGDQRLQQLRKIRSDATAELNQLQQYRARVASLLQSSTADRATANRRFRDAETSLQQLVQSTALSRADWLQIAEVLRGVRDDISISEQMAKEDIRLAAKAAEEIMQAQRELRQAESFYRSGFRADVSAVKPQLQTAQQALDNQNYEQAIEIAGAVVAGSRQEIRDAEYAANERERRRERERRDRERSLGAGLGMMATGLSDSSAAHHNFGNSSTFSMPDTSSPSTDSSTSFSSWSSETSQSSW